MCVSVFIAISQGKTIARFDLSYFAKGILGDYPVMIKAGSGNPNEIFPSFPTKMPQVGMEINEEDPSCKS